MTISSNRFEASNGVLSGGDLYLSGTVRVRNSIVTKRDRLGGKRELQRTDGRLAGVQPRQPRPVRLSLAGRPGQQDPLLGPLQPNGGPTPTMAPAPDGPAIDQGAGSGLAADQRGAIRPLDFPSIPNPAMQAPTLLRDIGQRRHFQNPNVPGRANIPLRPPITKPGAQPGQLKSRKRRGDESAFHSRSEIILPITTAARRLTYDGLVFIGAATYNSALHKCAILTRRLRLR